MRRSTGTIVIMDTDILLSILTQNSGARRNFNKIHGMSIIRAVAALLIPLIILFMVLSPLKKYIPKHEIKSDILKKADIVNFKNN